MTDVVDTSKTLAISYSPLQVAKLLIAGAILIWLSWFCATEAALDGRSLLALMGWIGLVFFGLCTVAIAYRSVATKGAVLVFSPTAFLDQRVSTLAIDWKAIESVDEMSARVGWATQRFLVLKVQPEVQSKLPLTPTMRLTLLGNRMLRIVGVTISASELNISHDKLMRTTNAYWKAHGPGSGGQSSIYA